MRRNVLPIVLIGLLAPAHAAAQTTLFEFTGGPDAYLANVAGGHDLNLDDVPDIVTGARFDNTAGADAGAVYVRSGATGNLLWWRYGSAAGDHLGTSLAMSPDLDGDGVWEVVVGAPLAGAGDAGVVYVLSGRTSAPIYVLQGNQYPGTGLGTVVAADFDFNEDGTPDICAASPFLASPDGAAYVWDGATGAVIVHFTGNTVAVPLLGLAAQGGVDVDGDGSHELAIAGIDAIYLAGGPWDILAIPGSPAGLTLGKAGDTDGDGGEEFLVGDIYYDAPFKDCGAVWLASFLGTASASLLLTGDAADQHLGAAVAGLGDIDGDGREDWALAATHGVSNPGHVRVVSGKNKIERYRIEGSPATSFPTDLDAAGDVNGDGFLDLVVGDPTGNDGTVAVYSAYGPGFVNYCTPGTSASGCQPTLSATGTPSAFAPNPFVLSANGVEGNTPGLFFYGWNGRQANAWGNGSSYQCVAPPVKRAGLLPKQGTSGQCNGAFSQDLNAHWSGNPGKNPGPGTVCQAQLWYRDPFNTSNQTTSMSDAIEFYVDF